MIRVWRKFILPLVEAAQASTIMEIGAEYGKSTNVLLNYVRRKQGHLYCIDPSVEFDAHALQSENPELLTFFNDLSLKVLPDHPPVDVALVDGDHNWYTVYHELQAIEKIHGDDPLKQPLIFVHDIAWPYGRRDLYYDPSNIPAEWRQPYARKGILPKHSELSDDGGMNVDLCNALHEGGERNGVLTGVEDFIANSEIAYRFVQIPLYYGLGILVSQARLDANPALAAELDKLDFSEEIKELLGFSEHLRCVDGIYLQSFHRLMVAAEERVAELEKGD
jgi:Methyltransferase domain